MVDPASSGPGPCGINVHLLDQDLMHALGEYIEAGGSLRPLLRVSVARTESPLGRIVPDILGCHEAYDDWLRFVPYFPFERGLPYQATFDLRPLGCPRFSDVLTLQFSLPTEEVSPLPEVRDVFPSSNDLPENFLRFYVCFSNPMRRGRAETEISLLGPDGEPAPDVLYRAPVELWNKSMSCLTILLDPGRLKRGVGPNRELGPPLRVGQVYTLVVGAGMTDLSGRQLSKTFLKRFRVTDAIRKPIAVEQWMIVAPETGSMLPLILIFRHSLDWALLSHGIAVMSSCGSLIAGQVSIDRCERRWNFTPTSPWLPGFYQAHVASGLEDLCGNTPVAAFDRPLRSATDLERETAPSTVSFHLA